MEPGDLLGRYELVRVLGRGGMGDVWLATDRELGRGVAIKLLHGGRLASDDARARLAREAQVMARLNHPNVAAIYDIGAAEGTGFIAMELLECTLREWLASAARTTPQIVDKLIAAARGLAAAHRASVIHRDVKPDNVLLGAAEEVKVTDFGIAEAVRGSLDPDMQIDPLGPLVTDGAIAGTPAYMAPELLRGDGGDARADQFSFCVMAWEALHDVLPFSRPSAEGVPTVARQLAASTGGAPVLGTKRVPRPLERVLRRGLAVDPAARYRDLDELADRLFEATRARRRRIAIGAIAITSAAAIAATAFAITRGPAADPCTGFDAALAGAWSSHVRDRIIAKFDQLSVPRAAEAARRVTAILDARATSWVEARTTVCRSAARGEVSPAVAEARVDCLERKRDELAALGQLLASADAQMVPRATAAADDTARVAGCLRELGSSRDTVPDDARFAEAREKFGDAMARRKIGRVTEAISGMTAAADAALEVGAHSLASEALLELAVVQTSANPDAANETLKRATRLAGEARDDLLVARCQIYAIYLIGYVQQHVDEALALRPSTEAAIARAGSTAALRYSFHEAVGRVLGVADRADEAWQELQAGLALLDSAPERNATSLLTTLNALGNTAVERGDLDAATQMFERAIVEIERRDGKDAPLVAYPTNNLGMIAHRQGRHQDAFALYSRAMTLFEASLPPNSPTLAITAMNVAMELERLGRSAEALPLYERSLSLREATFGPDHPEVAQTLVNFASLHARDGRFAQARAMLERAVAIRRKAYGADHILLASALTALAFVATDSGATAEGVTLASEALAIFDRTSRQAHPQVIEPLLALSRAHLAGKRARAALPVLERALALAPKAPQLQGQATFLLARAIWESGGDKARARELARVAHAALTSAGPAGEPWTTRAAAWLLDHERRR